MYEISVSGWFAAAHQLRLPDGTFEPLHGHNWRVTATLACPELDAMGVVADFTRVKPRLDAILAELHDRHLNALPAFAERNPSAEWVAVHIAERLEKALDGIMPAGVQVQSVEVEEAPGCVARWRK